MSKYILTNDILIFNQKVLNKGQEIDYNFRESYFINSYFGNIEIKFETLKDNIKLKQDIKIETIINDEDVDEVKNYRIQLDIKSTKRKVLEIENNIREIIQKII